MSQSQQTNDQNMVQHELPLAFVRGEVVIDKPQDLFIPPDALEVILESFEGPLDLLLYLIRKQKFDILDLPILPITEQYMKYVEVMKDFNMELASEYLVMAAILAEIKSRLLLPKQTVEEDELDPRAELVRRLQEYEVFKNAAQSIEQIPRLERDTFLGNAQPPSAMPLYAQFPDVDLNELVFAMQNVLKRSEAFEHHHIQKEALSTRERMSLILQTLQHSNDDMVDFIRLFDPAEGKAGVVVSFLAILELLKESLIKCIQTNAFGTISVKLA